MRRAIPGHVAVVAALIIVTVASVGILASVVSVDSEPASEAGRDEGAALDLDELVLPVRSSDLDLIGYEMVAENHLVARYRSESGTKYATLTMSTVGQREGASPFTELATLGLTELEESTFVDAVDIATEDLDGTGELSPEFIRAAERPDLELATTAAASEPVLVPDSVEEHHLSRSGGFVVTGLSPSHEPMVCVGFGQYDPERNACVTLLVSDARPDLYAFTSTPEGSVAVTSAEISSVELLASGSGGIEGAFQEMTAEPVPPSAPTARAWLSDVALTDFEGASIVLRGADGSRDVIEVR